MGKHRRPRHGRGSGPQGGHPLHDHYGGLVEFTSTGSFSFPFVIFFIEFLIEFLALMIFSAIKFNDNFKTI